jgi:DNA invertase Pin-like site-specific DNA recombinase
MLEGRHCILAMNCRDLVSPTNFASARSGPVVPTVFGISFIQVAEWDRATRSMLDGIAIVDRVLARGALVKVLDKPHLDLTSTIGKGLLAFLSAIAQDERGRIAKRANERRAAAKAMGGRFGRKPKLGEHQQAEALKRLAAGESRRAIARSYRCSHSTIGRLAGD